MANGSGKEIFVAFGVDVDAVGAGSVRTEARTHPVTSRAACSPARSGARLRRLFERYGVTTTWFWPGHSIETFGEQFDEVAAAGHEMGVHGYSHEPDRDEPPAGIRHP